jgi:hypothetical protein
MWWASQAQGLIDSIDTVERVILSIISDAERLISDLGRLVA